MSTVKYAERNKEAYITASLGWLDREKENVQESTFITAGCYRWEKVRAKIMGWSIFKFLDYWLDFTKKTSFVLLLNSCN